MATNPAMIASDSQRSRGPLRAVLAIAFAVIVALAGWIVYRERARR